MANGCRIGKVKFKSGGSLHVLPDRKTADKDEILRAVKVWQELLIKDLPNPVGFVCIAWDQDHTHTIHDYFSAGSNVSRSQGPTYVAECMRRRNAILDCG